MKRLLLALVFLCGGAAAQVPSKPLRILVPYAAGGLPDVLARTIGQRLSELTGQPVVAENRPGAGGVAATEAVLRAPPDGATLLVADSSIYSIGPSLNRKLPFDPVRDLAPVVNASDAPVFLVVNSALPARSLQELLAHARAKPGLAYGSSGVGTGHHLAVELMRAMSGVELTHVPYKGAAQSVPAVVAGDVAFTFGGFSSVAPHARSGKLRILAVNTGKRTVISPDTPTVAEAGLPGYELNITIGFLTAAGVPKPVIEALSAEFNKALATPEVRQRLLALGIEPTGSTPDQFSEAIRLELRQYAELVKKAGLKVD